MQAYHRTASQGQTYEAVDVKLPDKVEVSLKEVVGAAKEKSAFWGYGRGQPRMPSSAVPCWRIWWRGGLRSHRECW